MNRKLKTMGLALVAVFAMSAVVASIASATNDLFTTPEGGTTTLLAAQESGAGINKFKVVGQTLECTTVIYHAWVTGTGNSQVTFDPAYSGCEVVGVGVTIDMNGCKYLFTGNTDAKGHAQVHIEDCNAESHITLTVTGISCDITLKEAAATHGQQTNIGEGVKYTNIGSGTTKEITIDLTIKPKITVDTWPSGASNAICAEIEPAGTGRLTGSMTLTASVGATHVPIEVS